MASPDSPAPADAPKRSAGTSPRAWALFLAVGAPVLAADLILKAVSFADGPGHRMIPIVPKVLGIELVSNHGAIFGMGQGQRWLFILASVVAAGIILRLFWRSAPRAVATHVALALILAGALGNLYDRLRFGFVRDMLHLFPEVNLPWGLAWPVGGTGTAHEVYPWVFNVADVALLAGVILMAVVMYREPHAPRPPQNAPPG
jgi:signal peptidase II